VRTAASLHQAAHALTKAGDYISALWTIRACLLEPRGSFESTAALERAIRLETRLRAVIEGRASVPLSIDEAQLLIGEEPIPLLAKKTKKPEANAELIQRTVRIAPPPLPKLRPQPPPLAALRSAEPVTVRQDLRPKARPIEEPEAVTEVPPERPSIHAAITARNQADPPKTKPPIATRNATLPPSPKHRQMLREESEAGTWDEAKIDLGEPVQLVSDSFEIEVIWEEEPSMEWASLEEAPTDTSIPLPPPMPKTPELLGASYEITERIRARG
jgi:hypothetical protein